MPALFLKVYLITTVAQAVGSSLCDQATSCRAPSVPANIPCDEEYGLQLLQKTAHSRSGETDDAPVLDTNSLQLLQKKAKCQMHSQAKSELERKHWTLRQVHSAMPRNSSIVSLLAVEPYGRSKVFQLSARWLWPLCYMAVLVLTLLGAGRIAYPSQGEEDIKVGELWIEDYVATTASQPVLNIKGSASRLSAQNLSSGRMLQASSIKGAPMAAKMTSTSVPAKVQVLSPQGNAKNVSLNATEVVAPRAFVETLAMQPKEVVQTVEVMPTMVSMPPAIQTVASTPIPVQVEATLSQPVQQIPVQVEASLPQPVLQQISGQVEAALPQPVQQRQAQPESTVMVPVVFAASAYPAAVGSPVGVPTMSTMVSTPLSAPPAPPPPAPPPTVTSSGTYSMPGAAGVSQRSMMVTRSVTAPPAPQPLVTSSGTYSTTGVAGVSPRSMMVTRSVTAPPAPPPPVTSSGTYSTTGVAGVSPRSMMVTTSVTSPSAPSPPVTPSGTNSMPGVAGVSPLPMALPATSTKIKASQATPVSSSSERAPPAVPTPGSEEREVVQKGASRFDVLPDAIPLEEDVELIEPEEVYKHLTSKDETFVLIDVRDSDRSVGYIRESVHVPCNQDDGFDSRIDDLLEELEDFEVVTFHCQFSCHRAPFCANLYRARAPEHQTVAVMNGGFKGWLELGFPIVPGKGELAEKIYAESIARQEGRRAVEKSRAKAA